MRRGKWIKSGGVYAEKRLDVRRRTRCDEGGGVNSRMRTCETKWGMP